MRQTTDYEDINGFLFIKYNPSYSPSLLV